MIEIMITIILICSVTTIMAIFFAAWYLGKIIAMLENISEKIRELK